MDCIGVGADGWLEIGGVSTKYLAEKYGTPLYVMDEARIRENCRAYADAFKKYYGGAGRAVYACKALCCTEICRIMAAEGMAFDVVSGGEIYTAKRAGADLKNAFFHGNNKTADELSMALELGVGCIVVDNAVELETLADIARGASKSVDIMFRIKPGVEAHTHEFIRTGGIDSKFGVALENGEAYALLARAAAYENLNVIGLECHIGSQIFETEPFALAAQVMLSFMCDARKKLGLELKILDLGGGYGIRYTAADNPPQRGDYIRVMTDTVKDICAKLGMEPPFLMIEPGRSIVGDAGLTLYRVGSVKRIEGVRTYVAVDGGMGDNPRYTMYGSPYDMIVANKAGLPKDTVVTVAGRYCETDLLQEHISLQSAEPGDILAVLATGAYNYSMASNYNRVPRAPIVLLRDGEDRLAVRRETYEDILRCDV